MRTIFFSLTIIVSLLSCNPDKKEAAQVGPPRNESIPVKLAPLQSASGSRVITASGTLSTENEANLSFKIGGIIEAFYVKEGDRVKKGQLLASLKAGEIGAQVQQAQLAYQKAERDYQRAGNLYRDSVVTLEQMQNAKTGLDIARESLNQVQFNRQYAAIHAPADGFIVRKKANAGELASSGTAVLTMNASSASSKWVLKAGLSDRDWAAIGQGDKASVAIDAFTGKNFDARVSKKPLAADAAGGAFVVELQVDFGSLRPAIGMFGTAVITPSGALTSYSIPYEALLEADGKKGFVFVSDDRKTVKRVEVTIGDISVNSVSISSGLDGHAFVVTAGSPYLNDHSTITAL